MLNDKEKQKRIQQAAMRALSEAKERKSKQINITLPKEINGCKGKEPTRYEDWERKGIAYDF